MDHLLRAAVQGTRGLVLGLALGPMAMRALIQVPKRLRQGSCQGSCKGWEPPLRVRTVLAQVSHFKGFVPRETGLRASGVEDSGCEA